MDYGAVGDGSTDDAAAFTAALAAGDVVLVPEVATFFKCESGITIPAGKELRGYGARSRIEFIGSFTIGITLSAGSILRSLYLDGDSASKSSGVVVRAFVDNFLIEDVIMEDGKTYNLEIRGANGVVMGGQQLNCAGSAIALTTSAATGCRIEKTLFNGSVGFGNWVTGGATLNTFRDLVMTQGGLELVGVTFESPSNTIEYCTAEYSGDNGISVTSNSNVVRFNRCRMNANNGIGVYGSLNEVYGNFIENNGTQNEGGGSITYAGINMTPQFGGLCRGNLVWGNFIRETRETSLQLYGIKFERMQTSGTTAYIPWVSGGATGGRRYITAGTPMRVYRYSATTPPANMGTVEPTDTTGNEVTIDGTNLGLYLGAFDTSLEINYQGRVYGNVIVGCQYGLGFFGNQWTADLFVNNTILNPLLSCIQVGFVKTASTISNNALIGGTDTFTRASGSISHAITNNNCFGFSGAVSGGAAPVTVGGTNIQKAPSFVGGAIPQLPGEFALDARSALVGAGTDIAGITDFCGDSFVAPYDIGAFRRDSCYRRSRDGKLDMARTRSQVVSRCRGMPPRYPEGL